MNTIALILEGQDPVIVPYDTARDEYDRLTQLTLVEIEDRQLFAALTVALGVLPKPPLPKMPDGTTHAAFVISKWREAAK